MRIPRTEPKMGIEIANQPGMNPDALTGPGRALQQLGRAISGLSGAFEASSEPSDVESYDAKLAALDATTKSQIAYSDHWANMPGDADPKEHAARFGPINDEIWRQSGANITHPKLRQAYDFRWQDQSGRYSVDGNSKANGIIVDRRVLGVEERIRGGLSQIGAANPDELDKALDGYNAMIDQLPGSSNAQKEQLRGVARKHAVDVLTNAIKEGTVEEQATIADRARELIKKWSQPPAPQQGQGVGPQSSLNLGVDKDFSKGRGFAALGEVKQGILHDVSGTDRANRVLPNPQNISQYHITFDENGVYANVPLNRQAPHAADMNANTIGIARIGYEGEKLTPKEIDNGARALLIASEKTGLSLDNFSTHPSAGPAATRSKGGKDPREASWRDQVVARAKELKSAGIGHNGGPDGKLPSNPSDYLVTRLAKGYEKRIGDVKGLHPVTQDRLAAFIAAAKEAGHDISIVSGYRSEERQRVLWNNALKKYGSRAAARKWVAPPGGSSHQSGEAVDIQYGDRNPGLGGTRTEAVKWAHANAGKFGLNFPLGHEDWHIEPIEARRGGKRYGGKYAEDGKRYWQGGGDIRNAASGGEGIKVNLTAYSPQRGASNSDGGEGNYLSARPGPDGKNEVRTLADVQAGRSKYVTIAGNPRDYGKEFTIPEVSFYDKSGKKHTLQNVRAVVHDTGSAFKNAPEGRFDLAIDRDAGEAARNKSHALWKQAGIQFIPGAPQDDPQSPPVAQRGITTFAGLSSPQQPGQQLGTQVADMSGSVGASASSRPLNTIPGQQTAQVQQGTTPLVPVQPARRSIKTDVAADLMDRLPELDAIQAKARQLMQDRAVVDGQLKGEIPFNLYDKDDTKRLDEQYDMSQITERIVAGDVSAMALAVNNAKTLGYVPPKFRDTLLAMTRDMDPEKASMRVAGYEMASDIALAYSNAFAGENGGALKSEALDYASMVGTGMGQKEALAWIDEMRSPAWKKKESENAKFADAAVKKWDEEQGVGWVAETMADELDQDYTSDPVVESFLIPQMDGEFRAAFRRHFIRMPNADSAKERAMREIRGAYAVTRIGGEQRIQKYPIEKHYPAIGGKKTFWGEMPNYDYIEKDVVNSVQQWINERDNVIEPGAPDEDKPQGAAEITMKDIYLVGDDVTRRQIERRNPNEPPSYMIVFRDPKTELLQQIPPEQVRWSMPPQLIKALQEKKALEVNEAAKANAQKLIAPQSDAPSVSAPAQGRKALDLINKIPGGPKSDLSVTDEISKRLAPLLQTNQKPKQPQRKMSR